MAHPSSQKRANSNRAHHEMEVDAIAVDRAGAAPIEVVHLVAADAAQVMPDLEYKLFPGPLQRPTVLRVEQSSHESLSRIAPTVSQP